MAILFLFFYLHQYRAMFCTSTDIYQCLKAFPGIVACVLFSLFAYVHISTVFVYISYICRSTCITHTNYQHVDRHAHNKRSCLHCTSLYIWWNHLFDRLCVFNNKSALYVTLLFVHICSLFVDVYLLLVCLYQYMKLQACGLFHH